jgi:disulfide bond formation protein DsbB
MSPLVQTVTNILCFGTVVADVVAVFLFVLILTPLSERGWGKTLGDWIGRNAIWLSFLLAAGGTISSLFYSQYAHFAPCELCWIQRGFIYTQAVILLLALIAPKGPRRRWFNEFARKACLILSAVCFPISAYHVYLQLGGGEIVPCSAAHASCQYVYFIQYGYVTIPTMALTAVALIIVFMLFRKAER